MIYERESQYRKRRELSTGELGIRCPAHSGCSYKKLSNSFRIRLLLATGAVCPSTNPGTELFSVT